LGSVSKRHVLLAAFTAVAIVAGGALVACGGGGGDNAAKTVQIGSLKANDHGTKDISSASDVEIEVDDFYFNPTFIKGKAGEKVTINIANDSNTLHNFSVTSLSIDKDIAAKGKTTVEFTFPASAVVLFMCKYHTGSGMNGEALVGDAAPGAPSAAAAAASASLKVTSNATLGNILTDPAGRTLYTFANDVANNGKSATTGQLAINWPAFTIASGNPVKPDGLTGDLGTITRDDGTKQLTYKGVPLYYYINDAAPGDTKGQGLANVWFAAKP
jgi:predicted lipoprotein with Yx(FWY)xxD motif/uncharacterized cupredoxin-like copper-binding protein